MKRMTILIFLLSIVIESLNAQPFLTQEHWEKYFYDKASNIDPIEGLWNVSFQGKLYEYGNWINYNDKPGNSGLIAIYKSENEYISYSLSKGQLYPQKYSFSHLSEPNKYNITVFFSESSTKTSVSTKLLSGFELVFSYYAPEAHIKQLSHTIGINSEDKYTAEYEEHWIKIFPIKDLAKDEASLQPKSGSGFALSTDGFIVTNYHLINNAANIKVRGINSDYYAALGAKVIISDKNNDLAIIQIDDPRFTKIIGIIPYVLKTSLSSVGESVYILGYPLLATMGEEIKLTNGIISSRTGYKGDISSYQISAPVQPGNSGCPLFDSAGNIIGIINSKLITAENVSYAVKASYLINLIDLLQAQAKIQTVNTLSGKTIVQQVELVKNFIYIIEIE